MARRAEKDRIRQKIRENARQEVTIGNMEEEKENVNTEERRM